MCTFSKNSQVHRNREIQESGKKKKKSKLKSETMNPPKKKFLLLLKARYININAKLPTLPSTYDIVVDILPSLLLKVLLPLNTDI